MNWLQRFWGKPQPQGPPAVAVLTKPKTKRRLNVNAIKARKALTPTKDKMFGILREHPNMRVLDLSKAMGYSDPKRCYNMVLRYKHMLIKGKDAQGYRTVRVKWQRATAPKPPKYRYAFQNPEVQARALENRKIKAAERKVEAKKGLHGFEDPDLRHRAILARWPNHHCDQCPKEVVIPAATLRDNIRPSAFRTTEACKTTNLSLAAALYTKGHKLLDLRKDNRDNATFIFEQDANFVLNGHKFWNRTLVVDARTYHENLRMLRTRISNI